MIHVLVVSEERGDSNEYEVRALEFSEITPSAVRDWAARLESFAYPNDDVRRVIGEMRAASSRPHRTLVGRHGVSRTMLVHAVDAVGVVRATLSQLATGVLRNLVEHEIEDIAKRAADYPWRTKAREGGKNTTGEEGT